jgi:Flp pilus assembly protein TadG
MIRPNPVQPWRRGAIAPLSALVLLVLVAMMALAIDTGWIVLAESDLQSTADSAALAGANALMDSYTQYVLAGINSGTSASRSNGRAGEAVVLGVVPGGSNGNGIAGIAGPDFFASVYNNHGNSGGGNTSSANANPGNGNGHTNSSSGSGSGSTSSTGSSGSTSSGSSSGSTSGTSSGSSGSTSSTGSSGSTSSGSSSGSGSTSVSGSGMGVSSSTAISQATLIAQGKAAAIAAAKQYASLNSAGNVSLTLLDSDIEFGYMDATGTVTYPAPANTFPNTVRVTLRRDSSANGALSLFFGPAVGTSTASLTATAAATLYTADLNGFQNLSTFTAGILPMTYDVNQWTNFMQTGQDPDGTTTTDANGLPELTVYPSLKYTGNFGQLSLDDGNVGTGTMIGWIDNGMSQSDLQTLLSNSQSDQTPLVPLSQHSSTILPSASTDGMGSWNWQGSTGMTTDLLHELSNYVGQSFLLPLFQPLNSSQTSYAAGYGNGSNYYYNIVQFVSVKIISSDNANKGGLVVQPSPIVLNFSFDTVKNVAPAGTATTTTFTFLPPKLTQ